MTLSKIAHKRLFPSLSDPNFLVLRSRRLIFSSWAKGLGDGPLRVLDVGGRYQPYRPLLGYRIGSYVAIDLLRTELVSVIGSGEALPFAPGTFDLAIATQVFEFFDDPRGGAQEIHAALRPGGVLLASVAACVPRIVDDEHWRFTPSGIRSALRPFAQVEIVPEVSSIGGFFRLVNLAASAFLPWNPIRSAYNWTACPILNLAGLGFEALKINTSDQFTGNYSVRAVKAA